MAAPSNDQSIRQELEVLASATGNPQISQQVQAALDAIGVPAQAAVVTSAVKTIRTAKAADRSKRLALAAKLAQFALSKDPDNPYILGELAIVMRFQGGQDAAIIKVLTDFFDRVPATKLTAQQRDYLTVTLASAYKGSGAAERGISLLENLPSRAPNVLEALAELYLVAGRPNDTVSLLKDERRLTANMALWLGKSYWALSDRRRALQVSEPFKDNEKVAQFYREIALERQEEPSGAKESKGPRRVFISHSSQDEKVAAAVAELLYTAS